MGDREETEGTGPYRSGTRSPVAGRCRKVTASCSPRYSPEVVRGSFVVLAAGKACTTQPAIFSQTIAFLK